MMDIARQAFKEAQDDAYDHVTKIAGMMLRTLDYSNLSITLISHGLFHLDETDLPLEMRFEVGRQFFIRFPATAASQSQLPEVFLNIVTRRGNIECQTLDLLKLNQKVFHKLSCQRV